MMTHAEAKNILLERFKALPKKARDNLAWHAKKGTRILCGETFALYTDGDGGG